MGYDKLNEHVKQTVEKKRSPLMKVGFEWEQQKSLGEVKDVYGASPFEYIKGEFSPYLAHAVYSYLWRAMQEGLKMIRLGSAGLMFDERSDSLDDFSEIGEAMISYFLETVRYDKILRKHLKISQATSMLVITINS